VIRFTALALGLAWIGLTLILGEVAWFRRTRLPDRIRPYTPGTGEPGRGRGLVSVTSLRDIVSPLAREGGDRLSRLLGVRDELAARLRRAHSSMSLTGFRTRQLGTSVAAMGVGAVLAVVSDAPPLLALLLLLGAPLLAFLVQEQQAISASRAWQRHLFLELPVVAEQLGMLLAAGCSLGSALDRLSRRGTGVIARDLDRVCHRLRQGVGDVAALREWAELADVEALHRLVNVLALHREGGDLARLISEEARAIRADVHRELIETIERRGQQVWIPVTVATLVPGVLFMVVPFVEAMRAFTSS
jgi:tight adherence protein C